MAELTDEQVANAFAVFHRTEGLEGIRAAAPYLQIPWDEPTIDEIDGSRNTLTSTKVPCSYKGVNEAIRLAISWFVASRNASILPKPVDPRRDRIRKVLSKGVHAGEPWISNAADNIIAALDEVQ